MNRYLKTISLVALVCASLSSCKKDDVTTTDTSNTSNTNPVVEEAPLGKNFPAGECSYFPANEPNHYWTYSGPSLAYTTKTTGTQKTIDGKSWYELENTQNETTTPSYYRYEDGVYYAQLPATYEGTNYDLPVINLNKKAGETWDGPKFNSNQWTQNQYTFEMVNRNTTLEVHGITYENVIAIMLTTETAVNFWSDGYEPYSTIEQIAYYAKGVGFITQTSLMSQIEVDLIDSDLISTNNTSVSKSNQKSSIDLDKNMTLEFQDGIPIISVLPQ